MKRLLTGLVSLVFCFGAFAGCSYRLSGDSESGGDSALVGEIDFNAGYDYADTLKIWVSNVDTEKEIINAFVGAFKEVYPNITVEVEGVDSLDDQLVFNAGLDSMCDIFWVTPEDIALYRDYDIIAPLTPIIEQDPSFDIENLNENSVRSCTDDGTLYVMPRDYNQVVMYYNCYIFLWTSIDCEEMKSEEITVLDQDIHINKDDYFSLTDIARYKKSEAPADVVKNWLRRKDTIEFIGLWERLNNPDFNVVEFDQFKNEAGYNCFALSPKKWIEGAIPLDWFQKRENITQILICIKILHCFCRNEHIIKENKPKRIH